MNDLMGPLYIGICVCVVCALCVPQQSEALEYTVREPETLMSISKKVYGEPRYYKLIALLNGLDEKHYAARGERLFVPDSPSAKRPAATLVEFEGSVSVSTFGEKKTADVRGQDPILWMSGVKTGPKSTARLQLPDGSSFVLAANSELMFLGAGVEQGELFVYVRSGRFDWDGARPNMKLRVASRDGVAEVRGRSVHFGLDRGKYVMAASQSTVVFGTMRLGVGQWGLGHPKLKFEPKVLPEAPKWRLEGGVLDTQNEGYVFLSEQLEERVALHWTALPKGSVEVIASPQRTDTQQGTYRALFDPSHVRTTIPLAGTGVWRVRVRSVNAQGIAGPWRQRNVLRLRAAQTSERPLVVSKKGLSGVGGGAFMLAVPSPKETALYVQSSLSTASPKQPLRETAWQRMEDGKAVDVGGVHATSLVFELRDTRTSESLVRAQVPLSIIPIPNVSVSFSPERIDPLRTESFEVRVLLRDSNAKPILGEAPRVMLGRRTCTAQPTSIRGEYLCTLRPKVTLGKDVQDLYIEGRGGSFTQKLSVPVLIPDPSALPLTR